MYSLRFWSFITILPQEIRIIPLSQAAYYIDTAKSMEDKGIRQRWEQDLLVRNYVLTVPISKPRT